MAILIVISFFWYMGALGQKINNFSKAEFKKNINFSNLIKEIDGLPIMDVQKTENKTPQESATGSETTTQSSVITEDGTTTTEEDLIENQTN